MDLSPSSLASERFHHHALVEHAPYGVVVHCGERLLYANAEMVRLLGYAKAGDLSALKYSDLLPDGDVAMPEAYHDVSRKGQGLRKPLECRFVRKDGSTFIAEILTRTLDLDGQQARQLAVIDITDRKARERRMKESDALNRLLVASTHGGVVLQDTDYRILAINPAAERILGVSCEDALGQPLDILANALDEAGDPLLGAASSIKSVLISGEPVASRLVLIENCAGVKWLWFSAQPLVREGETKPYAIVSSFDDITELRDAQTQLYYSANHDELTGLPNRHCMQKQLEQSLAQARRRSESLALVYLDLDRFKNVNDSFGHAIGDKLLKEVSTRLTLMLRDSDWVARPGGDEFLVVLANANEDHARVVVERILAALSQPFTVGPTEFYTGASMGIALFSPKASDDTVEELLKAADIAMSCAKADGRTAYRFFEPAMLEAAHERLWLENNFRRGLDEGQFVLYYQPKACTLTGLLTGVEALVRWQHPERGLIFPAEFIPFAEESGLIVSLGKWVLRQACLQAKDWHSRGFDIPVAVNLAARQLRDVSLVADIHEALEATDLPAHLLELELTESALITNEAQALEALNDIRALGVRLYIDDFGTGYSSLSQIANFPLDALKIDLSFTARITTENKINALVRVILLLAKSLNMRVVAEGVETPAQLRELQALGCEQMQGYLISKPVLPSDLETNFCLDAEGGVLMFNVKSLVSDDRASALKPLKVS